MDAKCLLGIIERVARTCRYCRGSGEVEEKTECPRCKGDGCSSCSYKGSKSEKICCPQCGGEGGDDDE